MSALLRKRYPLAFCALIAACGGGGGGSDGGGGGSSQAIVPPDPPMQTTQVQQAEALHCTPFEHPDKPPVLLVHGTAVTGTEQFTFFYAPQLVAKGFDVCIVTYPDRGLGDMQVSAEFVVNALNTIYAQTGRKVAMIGHSQGALMPRWAIKFFPSARQALAEFVLIAGPNHGTSIAFGAALLESVFGLLGLDHLPIGPLPGVFYQFAPGSDFVTALNAGDETPGDIDYTNLYTVFDELVRPVKPVPTAALDFGQDNPQVTNILLQDVCPGHLSEHITIGTADPLAFALALDAISNPGPADFQRAGASSLCSLLPIDLAELLRPPLVAGLLQIVASDLGTGLPDLHLAASEPPLMPYARDAIQ